MDAGAAVPHAAVTLQRTADADAIVVVDRDGDAARAVAKFAPDVPVVALCPSRRVARQLSLSRGVRPLHVPDLSAVDAATAARKAADALGGGAAAAVVVVVSGDAITLVDLA